MILVFQDVWDLQEGESLLNSKNCLFSSHNLGFQHDDTSGLDLRPLGICFSFLGMYGPCFSG